MSREWEQIQQRTFTRWVNAQLKKRGMKIDDLCKGLADGIALINLYEVISDESLGKYNKKPRMRIHQLENLKIVITEINKFVSSVGIRVQYSGNNVLQGNRRDILGMIWCLIHKFQIQDISEEELSAREGLLLWCKKNTKGYKGVHVKNFNKSWQDGLAFLALIHKHHPDLVDYDKLSGKDKKKNLQMAFDIAEKEFDIPQLLDANDMVSYKPDDKSVMTYVAYYWKKFAAGNKQQKHGRKISRVAKSNQENKKLESDYEKRAKKLNEWISTKDKELSNTDKKIFGNCLTDVQKKQKAFGDFKKKEKVGQNKEKHDLELLLINLRAKQKNENLKIYTPPKELATPAIQGNWDKLNTTQKSYEKALREALQRMKYLERLLNRYRARSKVIRKWQSEKDKFLNEDIPKSSNISQLRAKINMIGAFDDEHKSVKTAMDGAVTDGNELVKAEHKSADEVMNTNIEMKKANALIDNQKKKRKTDLEALLKIKLEVEQWSLDLAKKTEKLNLFLEDAFLTLSEPVAASNVKDVERALLVLNKLSQLHKDSAPLETEIGAIEKKIKDAGENPLVYSRFSHEQIKKKYDTCKKTFSERKITLDKELIIQKENEKLLNQFANESKDYIKWTTSTIKAITKEGDGDLEKQLIAIQKLGEKAVVDSKKKLGSLTEVSNKLEEKDIIEQAEFTVQELQVLDDQVKSTFSKRARAIDEQILAKKMSSVTPEQIKEFKETFTYFDKDKSGKLNKNEFKAACAAVGEDIPDTQLESVFKKYDVDKDGFISFEEFISFMSQVVKEGTSYDDVLESFKALANGKDFITADQIRKNMDKDDADYLLSVMPKIKDGMYDYIKYANETFANEKKEKK